MAAHQPKIQLHDYVKKTYLDYKDIMAILDISRPVAYEILHSLPHVAASSKGQALRVRREVFEGYLAKCEEATTVMEKIALMKFVTVEGRRFYIRQQKGRTMVLQLANF